jgi:branched-chain amino acid transport system substrate-binding protein
VRATADLPVRTGDGEAKQYISSTEHGMKLTPTESESELILDDEAAARRSFLKKSGMLGLLGASALTGLTDVFATSGDTIRIGYISPMTGPFAPFAEADNFTIAAVKQALSGGLQIGGKKYKVEILARDDQSNSDRASNLASQLINREGVDLILAQGALTVVNVAQQCELNGVPCITTMTPWQAWMFPLKGSPDKGFKSVYHFFWGIEDIAAVYSDIWQGLPTNKVVGTVWSNDVPGNAMGDPNLGMPGVWAKEGYKIVDIGRFQTGADDFSTHIQAFKREGVEIITGLFNPPEWATFWRQSKQLGFKPKVATVAKALLFPAGVEALGQEADRMSTEIWWTPAYPFKSTVTGQSTAELKNKYESSTKRRWTQPLGVAHAMWELGIHALKTSGNPKNPQAVSAAIGKTSLETVIGRVSWADSPIKNVAKMRVVGGQWRILPGKGVPELFITNNRTAPEIPVERKFEPFNQV